MRVFIDTNVLVRGFVPGSADNTSATDAIAMLSRHGVSSVTSPQNLQELWVICTRPARVNGFGFTLDRTMAMIQEIMESTVVLDDRQSFEKWLELVESYSVRGKPAHVTRVVATMVMHEVDLLLTFNVRDFRRFREIRAVSPRNLLELERSLTSR